VLIIKMVCHWHKTYMQTNGIELRTEVSLHSYSHFILDKVAKNIHFIEKPASSTNGGTNNSINKWVNELDSSQKKYKWTNGQ
jgi:hypothetical protein